MEKTYTYFVIVIVLLVAIILLDMLGFIELRGIIHRRGDDINNSVAAAATQQGQMISDLKSKILSKMVSSA